MNDILNKIMGKVESGIKKVKINMKKIIKISIVTGVVCIGLAGVTGYTGYNYIKSNINYTKEAAREIALNKIPGEVIRFERDLEIEKVAFLYKFDIKDKDNILQEVTVCSKSGAIVDIENPYNERYDD